MYANNIMHSEDTQVNQINWNIWSRWYLYFTA